MAAKTRPWPRFCSHSLEPRVVIYVCYYLVYIHGRKGSARMIYVCTIWYTFGVRRGVLEWYMYVLFGIHSGSEGECSNDIRLFLFNIHSGSEGECSIDMRMHCLVYIRGQKGSARMIYTYFFWYTFEVWRGVLERYTVGNMIGWHLCITMCNEQYDYMISILQRVYWDIMIHNKIFESTHRGGWIGVRLI